jgi:glycosyltransferase involved in cell wall biosynthesis
MEIFENPLVTIIIPVFNGSNFVNEAIESALGQTYKNKEVIVVNDGSNDAGKTRKAVLPYLDKIQYFEKDNGGVSTALKFGIKKTKGEYISWLSHDDFFSNRKIELQIRALQKQNNPLMIPYGKSVFVNSKGKIEKYNLFISNRKTSFSGMLQFFPLNMCFASCLLPRGFLLTHPFNEEARYSQDIEEFYVFLKNNYCFFQVRKALYFSRNHGSRISVTRKDLFEHDATSFHKKLMEDIETNQNYGFAKLYLYFLSEKSVKYEIYKKMKIELADYLASKKQYGFFVQLKSNNIIFFAMVGFALRDFFTGR